MLKHISIGAYALSLVMPALYLEKGEAIWGFQCLLYGAILILVHLFVLLLTLEFPSNWWLTIWFANSFILAAWLITDRRISFGLALTASIACISFYFGEIAVIDPLKGQKTLIPGLGLGYFTWTLSAILMCIYNFPFKEKE